MERRYEIVQGHTPRGAGLSSAQVETDWWSVVEYDEDGECKGGDAHWVRRHFAEAAKDLYEKELATHGKQDSQQIVRHALYLNSRPRPC